MLSDGRMKIVNINNKQKFYICLVSVVIVICLYYSRKRIYSEPEHIHHNKPLNAPNTALTFRDKKFFLDGKELQILSGALHYFRVVPEYWIDRLKKLKASGLNTVETWVQIKMYEFVIVCFKIGRNMKINYFPQI